MSVVHRLSRQDARRIAVRAQLLTAERSLPTAENGLLAVWINYLNWRLQLYRDLELLPLVARVLFPRLAARIRRAAGRLVGALRSKSS